MADGEPAESFRYWAFVSYSHQDKRWGRWLHKSLESYRIPSVLVGMPIKAGVVPSRLAPVFLDRDELPTSIDLDASIREALRQSWCLIVVCSPAAAASRWVNEEVLAFQELGRSERIHCLIVEGDDDATATPCFPPAIAASTLADSDDSSEPIAADVRHHGDGRTNAKLKLISGILGVGFDKLVRREQHRRRRTAWLVISGLVVLLAVLSTFTVLTITSRRDAVDQRSHAENLVEFMLGDLRKKLEPEGKLATLDAVGKEALAYYASQDPDSLDTEALARRARALHLIGEVYDLRGELDEAQTVFRQAADSTAELVAREPDNAQRLFDHGQSMYWVGYVPYQRGDLAAAEPAFQQYKEISDRLAALDPTNADWHAEVGYANSNLGTLLFEQGRLDEAARIYEAELDTSMARSRAGPVTADQQMHIAQAHAWLADVNFMRGRLHDAADHRQAEIAIYEGAITLDPKNNEANQALAIAERTLANIQLRLGRTQDALVLLLRARDVAVALLQVDPDNSNWSESACATYISLADTKRILGDLAGSRDAAASARKIAAALVARDASVVVWQIRLAASAIVDANRLVAGGNALDALRLAQGGVQRVESLPPSSLRGSTRSLTLARGLLAVASAYAKQGQSAAADKSLENVVSVVQPIADRAGPEGQAMLAMALFALGRKDDAAPLIEKLRGIDYRSPEYVDAVQ